MTEAPAAVSASVAALEPAALIALDLWSGGQSAAGRLGSALGGGLPALGRSVTLAGGWRTIRVEPTLWWLSGPLEELDGMVARLEAALGDDGAVTDLTGGFTRLAVTGPGWREALMFGGVFDAEDRRFGADCTAGTQLHHAAVRYDVVAAATVHIHVAPSYVDDLLHHLRAAIPSSDGC